MIVCRGGISADADSAEREVALVDHRGRDACSEY